MYGQQVSYSCSSSQASFPCSNPAMTWKLSWRSLLLLGGRRWKVWLRCTVRLSPFPIVRLTRPYITASLRSDIRYKRTERGQRSPLVRVCHEAESGYRHPQRTRYALLPTQFLLSDHPPSTHHRAIPTPTYFFLPCSCLRKCQW